MARGKYDLDPGTFVVRRFESISGNRSFGFASGVKRGASGFPASPGDGDVLHEACKIDIGFGFQSQGYCQLVIVEGIGALILQRLAFDVALKTELAVLDVQSVRLCVIFLPVALAVLLGGNEAVVGGR